MIVGLVASALAGWVAVAPQQGDGPETTLESKLPLVLTWEGGVADIELRVGTRWKVVDRAVTSPYTTKPLPIASALRVSGSNGVIGVAIPDGVWTPSDLAAWSGDGLRGAAIGGIAGTPEALWVGTLGGGLSMWDGARWRHIDRRDGLPSLHIHSVALDGGDRWIGHGEGATRIRADGSLTHWWIDRGGAWDVRPADRGGAWAATQAGIVRLDERGVSTVIADPSCWRLLTHPDAGTVASCGTRVLRVPDASPLPELAADTAVIGLVPRADGVWVARPDRLDTLIQGTMHPWWAPDDEGAVLQSLIQLGGGLFVTASTGQGVPGWRITEAGASPLLPADGVQAGDGLLAAAGPRNDKIWLGSTRGVALVSEQGAGTPLPNVPLPAGLKVHDARPIDGSLAVAGEAGLAWVGEDAPNGWSSLAAAVGAPALAVVYDPEGGWWGVNPRTAFRLYDGVVSRWDLDANAVSAVSSGTGVAFATDQGLRWWVRGARMLSPVQPLGFEVEDLAGTLDGTVWVAGADRVLALRAGDTKSWTGLDPVYDLATDRDGVWVATSTGLLRIEPGQPGVQHIDLKVDRLIGVGTGAARTHVIDADGRLHRADPDGLRTIDLSPYGTISGSTDIFGDEHGVWVASSAGLFRVVPVDGAPVLSD